MTIRLLEGGETLFLFYFFILPQGRQPIGDYIGLEQTWEQAVTVHQPDNRREQRWGYQEAEQQGRPKQQINRGMDSSELCEAGLVSLPVKKPPIVLSTHSQQRRVVGTL